MDAILNRTGGPGDVMGWGGRRVRFINLFGEKIYVFEKWD